MQNNLDLSLRQRVLYISVTSCCGNMEVLVLFVFVSFCLFVCLFVFLDVVLFFGCLCLCFFLALCKIRTTSRDTSINEKSTA